jgi:alanyl-tRNA synthetase
MTERLYYVDPYIRSFDATVTGCEVLDGRAHVTLDRTAFYPTSGGQPHDLGALGGVAVVDVIDHEGGVVHVLHEPLSSGTSVHGEIDWSRRFDHMQQHTGQHVLSAAFESLSSARTESFHLGEAASTIDLAREVSPAAIEAAVDEANRIVWEDRPVAIRFVTDEEAATLALRKEPARTGLLRLIEVEDFDLSACGGTHVARTGAIGLIAVSGSEKFRGGTRVEFLCGGRALRRFRTWRDALAGTMRYLSVPPEELASGIERLQQENKSLGRTIRGLQEQLAVHEARALVARGARIGDRIVVVEALEGWDAQGLKAMAVAAAREPAVVVALVSRASPALVVVAGHRDAGLDAGAVVKSLVGRFGGKGGGRPDLAQGGGLAGSVEDLLAASRELLGASSQVAEKRPAT